MRPLSEQINVSKYLRLKLTASCRSKRVDKRILMRELLFDKFYGYEFVNNNKTRAKATISAVTRNFKLFVSVPSMKDCKKLLGCDHCLCNPNKIRCTCNNC